jgi:hypothetical protein
MKIKVNVATWKSAVNKANSLSGKASSNPNESCVHIYIKEGNSYLAVVESGVHNTKINLTDIKIIEEGSCYIQVEALTKLTKSLFSKELTVELKDNKLIYGADTYGSISEPIYHNPSPFHGMLFAPEDYTLIEKGVTSFSKLLKTNLKPFVEKVGNDPAFISVILNKDNSTISGNISLAGGLVYSFTSETACSFAIKTALVKSMMFILDELDTFKLEKGATTIKLSSSKGETVLIVDKVKEASIQYLVKSFSDKEDSSAILKSEELINVILWQSYGATDGSCISIQSEEDKLLIKGDKTEESSSLDYNETSVFNSIKLPTDGLSKAVSILSKDSVATLKTTVTEVAGRPPVKSLLVIMETNDYTSTAYLAELALLS